jgi:hypothetical protein
MKPLLFLTIILYSLCANVSAGDHHKNHDPDFEFSQQNTHDHGKVVATISYSQNQINLHLTIPAFNAFGFEHTPTNIQEQELVDNTLDKLSKPNNVVLIQPNCAPSTINPPDSHKHGLSNSTGDHYDLELEYAFICPSNQKMSIAFPLFKTVPSIHYIEVQYISDEQQKLILLNADNHILKIH